MSMQVFTEAVAVTLLMKSLLVSSASGSFVYPAHMDWGESGAGRESHVDCPLEYVAIYSRLHTVMAMVVTQTHTTVLLTRACCRAC